jgi:hypothetical protein
VSHPLIVALAVPLCLQQFVCFASAPMFAQFNSVKFKSAGLSKSKAESHHGTSFCAFWDIVLKLFYICCMRNLKIQSL